MPAATSANLLKILSPDSGKWAKNYKTPGDLTSDKSGSSVSECEPGDVTDGVFKCV